MAYAQRAYGYDAYSAFAGNAARELPARRERERFSSADVRTVRTGGSREAEQAASLLATAARLGAVLLVVIAALCFARIALTNAAVTTMIESDTLSAQIEEARSSGIGLEMQQSVMTSPSSLKSAVHRLGMAAPVEVGTIALDPDVVAVTDAGELSLSETVKNVVEVQG